ncbi:M55 family metallopeptidase [Acidobacteriota bacterium]
MRVKIKTRSHMSLMAAVIFSLMFFPACTAQQEPEDLQATFYSEPAPNDDGVLRILVLYDMEGLSGQNDWRTTDFSHPEFYSSGRELLTDDVNAVIDGLYAGGAEEVMVVDGHGSGNPEPDIILDKMDPRAEMINREEPFDAYADLPEMGGYDAVAVVGMHSKTGGGGFLAHTYTIGMDWILNERSINETEIVAYSWGRFDVPVIFASGDNKLQEQLEIYPWIEFVRVKDALSADDAELRPLPEVHEEMRASARKAVENLSSAKALKLRTPIQAGLRAVHPASLSRIGNVPGINYQDETVTFAAADYREAYDGIVGLISAATDGYDQVLRDVLVEKTDFRSIVNAYREKLTIRWQDVESGRWDPPSPPQKEPSSRKHFGYR